MSKDSASTLLPLSSTAEELQEYMRTLTVIDAHEHLLTEPDRVALDVDVLTLMHNYEYWDLVSAGLSNAGTPLNNLFTDKSVPFQERWRRVWPYVKKIRHGSYFRALAIALRDIYQVELTDEESAVEASRRIKAANKKGLYHDILRKRCGIETCLVQNMAEVQDPADLLTPLFTCIPFCLNPTRESIKSFAERADIGRVVDWHMEHHKECGAIGMKMWTHRYVEPGSAEAREDFAALLKGGPCTPAVEATVLHHCLKRCGEWGWPVAVHTGVWGDFRNLDPKQVIDFVMHFPDLRFDIYHLGMPFARDCMFIAKNFPNAFLNLCWIYIVSETIAESSINEVIDLVPVNKVFGFGGDMVYPVESVYGHLVMARDCLARALARRIDEGRIDLDGSKEIINLWLYENPKQFYLEKA